MKQKDTMVDNTVTMVDNTDTEQLTGGIQPQLKITEGQEEENNNPLNTDNHELEDYIMELENNITCYSDENISKNLLSDRNNELAEECAMQYKVEVPFCSVAESLPCLRSPKLVAEIMWGSSRSKRVSYPPVKGKLIYLEFFRFLVSRLKT